MSTTTESQTKIVQTRDRISVDELYDKCTVSYTHLTLPTIYSV